MAKNIHSVLHFVIDNITRPVVLSARPNVTVLTEWSPRPHSSSVVQALIILGIGGINTEAGC